MSDKPLHVQVAEALGQSLYYDPRWTAGPNQGWHGDLIVDSYREIPRYDTDWSATGPLIERFEISVVPNDNPDGDDDWMAVDGAVAMRWGADEVWGHDTTIGPAAFGPTPLVAVCRLILALKAAGKLDA